MQEVLNAHANHGSVFRTGAANGGWGPIMSYRAHLALVATLITGTAWGQEVTATSTTIARTWRQDTPGMGQSTYTPATEYLGVDATRLGLDGLSMHLYGWGASDLADASAIGGKQAGNLTYGYLQYDFGRANAQVKAGRFTVNQGVGNEQVDGITARTDLRFGFLVSGFAGKPVIFKNLSNNHQDDNAYEHDFTYGGRLAWREAKVGELGVSYLQDGSQPAYDLGLPGTVVDYTRRELGLDVHLTPTSRLDVAGRTVFDVNDRPQAAPGADNSHVAEHNYKVTGKLSDQVALTGTFVERNFFAYFAGTTLPSLFNQNEQGMFRASGASLTWAATSKLQVLGDLRRTDRGNQGDTTRIGADLRYALAERHIQAGGGYHQVNGFTVASVDTAVPTYSLSHREFRAWIMAERGAASASLDTILLHYDDANNPSLNHHATQSAVMGSVGYQARAEVKVSGDLSYEDTPLYQRQVAALLRVECRFGLAGKGGK